MKHKRSIEALVLVAAVVTALAQPHLNGLSLLACVMVATVFAVEYRYTCQVSADLQDDRS